MKKKISRALILVAAAGLLSGCGSNAAEHSNTYFKQISTVLDSALHSSQRIADAENAEEELDPNALLKPENFTVNEDGTFSFDAVEGASAYYLGIYSDKSTKEALYSCQIDDDGSASYSSSVDAILEANASTDFMGNAVEAGPLTYGEWSIRVSAVPDFDTSDKKASPEAKGVYTVSGEVSYGDIEFASMWNTFSNELTVSVDGMDCADTMYPTEIVLTLTNEADSSDVVTVNISDIADNKVEAVTSDVQMDAIYSVAADFRWDPEFVTNPEYSADGGEAETSSENNLITGDFYYVDSIFHSFGFPHVQENFDPEEGGLAGVWYKDPESTESNGFGGMAEETATDEEEDKNAYFEATPKDAENGAAYSYDIVITSPAGMIYATPYTDSGKGTTIIWGTLDIFEDGTFRMETEYQYILTDMISSGVFYIPGAICEGKYTTNADGTINLNYDHTNCYESDYEIITELTGKAAEYAEDHPDFVQKFEMPSFMAGGDIDAGDDSAEDDAAEEGAPEESADAAADSSEATAEEMVVSASSAE